MKNTNNKYTALAPQHTDILLNQGTEPAFSQDCSLKGMGTYVCRGCGVPLFQADAQFTSQCGWPSFDEALTDAVIERLDKDGQRQEIICANCQGHLGHVFRGEHYTELNTRHCVNALAVEFVPFVDVLHTDEVIVAGGCFWGVEHLMQQQEGVLKTEVGYIGGGLAQPSYEQVCHGKSGHVEAVRVVFDSDKVTLKAILQLFFEIHDFTQTDGQGPDRGPQYLSRVYVFNQGQKQVVANIMQWLEKNGYKVATTVHDMQVFWLAEVYHQAYYQQRGEQPYCHRRQVIFSR